MAVCSVMTLVVISFVKNRIYDFLQQINIKTSEMCKNTKNTFEKYLYPIWVSIFFSYHLIVFFKYASRLILLVSVSNNHPYWRKEDFLIF